jgi:TonB family protein
VSEDPHHDATTERPSKFGGAAKWVLGGAAAVLLLGAGYFAWKTVAPGQDDAQVAYTDPYSDEPAGAGSIDAEQRTSTTDAAPNEDVSASASSETRTPSRRRARAAAPEVTIGVTPASASAEASSTDSDEIVVTAPRRPIWASTPSPRRLSALYPERALARGREGEARLHCIVQAGGALDCERVSETPGGFGVAALRVARRFRHASTLADGSDATGAPVNLRVVFRMEDERRRG